MEKENGVRIFKNSLWLYLRMILNIGIALLFNRILLNTLGANDFGTADLLNSLVIMFLFFGAAVSNVIQHFFNTLVKTGETVKARTIFSMVTIFTVLASAVILLGESFFCEWIITHKLKINPAAAESAGTFFSCLLVSVFFQTVVLPWQECILAKEHMGFYAALCLGNSVLKLLLALALQIQLFPVKLESYGIGLIVISVIYWVSAVVFCKRKIPESEFHFVWDNRICREVLPLFGYTIIGNALFVLTNQGIVVLLGIFFGPLVNAAYAIGTQIRNAVTQISSYFAMAIKPQLVQAYAEGDMAYVRKFFFSSCKFSYYAQLFLITPIILETPYLLKLWLKTVPEYTVVFTWLMIVSAQIWAFFIIFSLVNVATGKNRNFEIFGRLISISSLFAAYVVLKFNGPPWSAIALWILGDFLAAVYLLIDIRRQIQIPLSSCLKNVIGITFLCTALSWGIMFLLKAVFPWNGFLRFAVLSAVSVFVNLAVCFFLGCDKEEQRNLRLLFQKLKQRKVQQRVA